MGMQGQSLRAASKTDAAWQAFSQGQRAQAYLLSLEATRFEPNNSEAWFARSAAAPSLEEKSLCLSRAQTLSPANPYIKKQMYHRVRDLLEQDPFLAYLEETEHFYRVRNNGELILTIAKDRAIPERFPSRKSPAVRPNPRLMSLAIIGLIPAGLGALVFAPMLGYQAAQALSQSSSQADRVRARVSLIIASLVFGLGLGLSYLFWIHLRG